MANVIVEPFSLTEDRYDQSEFTGRLKRISSLFNPLYLFASAEEIAEAQQLLADYGAGKESALNTNPSELWDARSLIDARVHPDTGKPVPRFLCFAAYAPLQPPIIMGLMWPGAGMASALFWQWWNQSYNVAVNYANRNEASTLTDSELALAYGAGVTTAMGATLGFAKLTERMVKKFPAASGTLKMFIPFISIVAAGTVTLVVVRRGELTNGVAVSDSDGNVYGNSKKAGMVGISQCAIARVLWNIPVLILPPLFLARVRRTAFLRNNPKMDFPILTATVTGAIVLGIYPAQAVFAQRASIDAKSLEPEFQNRRHPTTNELVQTYWFNKGL
eukprot:m.453814 g.453814  ORF g.453814 m.453814 type:complete len:332 (+) comp20559_c0_seq1:222-1217(+)